MVLYRPPTQDCHFMCCRTPNHRPRSTLLCECVQGPQPCSTRSSAVFYKVLSRVLQGPQPCSTRSSAVFYKVLSRVLQGPQSCSTRSSAVFYKVLSRVLQGPQPCSTRSSAVFYKVLSRVLQGPQPCSTRSSAVFYKATPIDWIHLSKRLPAERRTSVVWSDELLGAFKKAQSALIPQPSDVLWIVIDGSVKNIWIAAILYVSRSDKLLLAGFFNAKLRKHQITWLPCEFKH